MALNKPAFASSVYAPMIESNANDGNVLTAFCTTMNNVNPWWAVDLGKSSRVIEVDVVNDNNAYYGNKKRDFSVKLC